MIDHVGLEVSDLAASARFYDSVLRALGARRMVDAPGVVAWGVNGAQLWISARHGPAAGYGHLALRASGRAAVDAAHRAGTTAGGRCDGPPGLRPRYGERYYAAYLRDPDGLRVEVVSAGRG